MNNTIRKQFPILSQDMNGHALVYLDSAATTQKPESVIKSISEFYSNSNANVHRSMNALSEKATKAYEDARKAVAEFIHAKSEKEIVFLGNATQAINLVAKSWGQKHLKKGDGIVLAIHNHHANIVPWIQLAKEKELDIQYIPLTDDYRLDLQKAHELITQSHVKLVAFTHVSNVLGGIEPIEQIISMAKKQNAMTVLDAAQSVSRLPIHVQELDIDFMAFSGHKMYGPTGIGVLYAKAQHLESMPSWIGGGGMIHEVFAKDYTDNDSPYRFEAGTPPIAQAVGLHDAISYIQTIGFDDIINHEQALTSYALQQLSQLDFVELIGPKSDEERTGVLSFAVKDMHAHDVADALGNYGIATRAGHHCVQPLHDQIGVSATVRISFGIYNTKEEIDVCIQALKEIYQAFTK